MIKTSHNTSFAINSLLHITILFCFLSILFVFIISKLTRETITNELNKEIEDIIGNQIKNISPEFKTALNKIPYSKLKNVYSEESEYVRINNKWLLSVIISINIILFTILIFFIVVLKYSCDQSIPIFKILIENIILFSFIGMVEYKFFINIASKYIPSLPSHMSISFKNSLQKYLKKELQNNK